MKKFPFVSWWMQLSHYWNKVFPLSVERAEHVLNKLNKALQAAGITNAASGRRLSFCPQIEELRERILPSINAVNDYAAVKSFGTINLQPLVNDSTDDEEGPVIVEINGEEYDAGDPIFLPSGATLTVDEEGNWEYEAPETSSHLIDEIEYTIANGSEETSLATVTIVVANGQWATGVVSATSTYDSGSQDWSAAQVLGEPNTDAYGDYATAWATQWTNGSETITEDPPGHTHHELTLSFPTAVHATGFLIRENNGNGFVTKVEVGHDESFATVWEDDDDSPSDTAVDFVQFFSATTGTVDEMRITVDVDHDIANWEEIDAVRLFNNSSVVDPSNHGPTVHDGFSVETDEDTPVTVDALVSASAYDQDGDPLFLTVVTPPEHGSVAVNNNGTPNDLSDDYFVYTPDPNYNGTDSFEFALVDIHGAASTGIVSATNPGLVSITVNAVNDDPAVVDDYGIADESLSTVCDGVVIHVLDNDYDVEYSGSEPVGEGPPTSYHGLQSLSILEGYGPSHGTVSIDGFDIRYYPGDHYVGDDELVYEITDGNGGSATATLHMHVYPTGQWASLVSAVSSEYGDSGEDEDWSANKALGAPDTREYGDIPTAWAPEEADSEDNDGEQYIIVGFDEAEQATGIIIRETSSSGFVKEIWLIEEDGVTEHQVEFDSDPFSPDDIGELILTFEQTGFDVKYVKIVIDTNEEGHTDQWEEIDAVRLLTGDYEVEENMMMRNGMEMEGPSPLTATVKTRVDLGHGQSKEITYDGESRPVLEVITQHGDMVSQKAFSYDEEEGFLAAEIDTDAIGRQTRMTFDSDGRTLSKTLAYGTAGAATTSYEYEDGNLVALTDPDGNTTTWEYADGREISMTDPLGHTVYKTYDENGRLKTILNRDGLLRTFDYDEDGRLSEEVWYAGATTGSAVVDTLSFAYTDGRLTSAENSVGSYDLTYNLAGQLTDVEEPFGVWLHFGYDAAGHRNVVEDSFGGRIDSTYNAQSQLVSRVYHQADQPTLRIDFEYDSQGRIKKQKRYNDAEGTQLVAESDFSYGKDGQLIGLLHKDAEDETLADYSWEFDDVGQLISQVDHGVEKDYTYDDQGQLKGDGTSDYSYDLNGNRNGEDDDVSDGNRLNTNGTWDYTYDLEGNVTKKSLGAHDDTWVYGYDNKNEMISATEWDEDPDTVGTAAILQKVEFKYDVFGNRVQKRVDTDGDSDYDVTQRYALDGWNTEKPDPVGNENWDVWADLDGSSSLTTRYLRGDVVDQLFARVDGNDAYWLLTDHLGSVRDVISNSTSTTVLDSIAYDAFGNATPANSTADATYGGRYKWTGREFDVETQLQYNRARYYDAATGRWMSQDPMGFDAGDSNLYRYSNNRAVVITDPSGLQITGQACKVTENVGSRLLKTDVDVSIPMGGGELKGKVSVWKDRTYTPVGVGQKTVPNGIQIKFTASNGQIPLLPGLGAGSAVHWLQAFNVIAYKTVKVGKTTSLKQTDDGTLIKQYPKIETGAGNYSYGFELNRWQLDTPRPNVKLLQKEFSPYYDQSAAYSYTGDTISLLDRPQTSASSDEGWKGPYSWIVFNFLTYLVYDQKAYIRVSWRALFENKSGVWTRAEYEMTQKGSNTYGPEVLPLNGVSLTNWRGLGYSIVNREEITDNAKNYLVGSILPPNAKEYENNYCDITQYK